MQAVLFALKDVRQPGQLAGLALVCAHARYVSVRLPRTERLERRFATAQNWRSIMTELSELNAQPLFRTSALHHVIAA